MTPYDSKLRGFLYVAIAILAFMSGGIASLPISSESKIWMGYIIGTIAAGSVALRAYIDESTSQVPKQDPDPEPEKKPYQ